MPTLEEYQSAKRVLHHLGLHIPQLLETAIEEIEIEKTNEFEEWAIKQENVYSIKVRGKEYLSAKKRKLQQERMEKEQQERREETSAATQQDALTAIFNSIDLED